LLTDLQKYKQLQKRKQQRNSQAARKARAKVEGKLERPQTERIMRPKSQTNLDRNALVSFWQQHTKAIPPWVPEAARSVIYRSCSGYHVKELSFISRGHDHHVW
jgi:hypothetical protein